MKIRDSKLKVLFVASVEEHILCFHIPYVQYFMNSGYEVHVATKMGVRNKELIDLGIVTHNVDFSRSPYSLDTFKAFKQLISLMKINKYSLVHTHTPVASFLSRIAAKLTNTKHVLYTAHGFHFYKGAPKLNWLVYYPIEFLCAKLTDGLITINKEDYHRAGKFSLRSGGKLFYVKGVGLDTNDYCIKDSESSAKYRQELGIKEDSFVIISVAELNENKNQIQIIKAIEKMNNKNITLLLVGKGELWDHIKNYIHSKKLGNTIKMLGHRKDIPELLNASDCIALLSLREGLPRSLMEGMAAGLPAITTNVRGCRDLVINNQNGYVVEVGDIDATINAIQALRRDKEQLLKFSEASKKMAESYSLANVEKEMRKIYTRYIK